MPSFVSKSYNHIIFFDTSFNTTYSTSIDKKTTVNCQFKYQLIDPPLSIKIYPDIDFLII